jgi:hypothetical protein
VSRLWTGWQLSSPPALTLPFLVLLAVPAVLGGGDSRFGNAPSPVRKGWIFPWHEIAALGAVLSTPLIAFVASRLAHAPLYGRYSLIVSGGFACLIGAAMARSNAMGLLALWMTVMVIIGGFSRFCNEGFVTEPATGLTVSSRSAGNGEALDWMTSAAPGEDPIVLVDDLAFAPIFHYASPSARARFVFLIPDMNGQGYARLQRCCRAPGTVESRSGFLAGHGSFLVFGRLGNTSLLRSLGGKATIQGCRPEGCMFRVSFPEVQAGIRSSDNARHE